jgi:hypothetical protein
LRKSPSHLTFLASGHLPRGKRWLVVGNLGKTPSITRWFPLAAAAKTTKDGGRPHLTPHFDGMSHIILVAKSQSGLPFTAV